jgi:hypothetical protein
VDAGADVSQETGPDASEDAGPDVSVDQEVDAGLDVASEPEAVSCTGEAPPLPGTAGAATRVTQGGDTLMSSVCNSPQTEQAPNTFDNNTGTKFLCFMANNTAFPNIEYRFADAAGYAVNAYTVTSASDAQGRDPMSWRLEGSNDEGVTWSLVDIRTNQTFANRLQTNSYVITNCSAYIRYRFVVTGLFDPNSTTFQVAEVMLFGPQAHGPSEPTNDAIGGAVTIPQTCGGTNPLETPDHAFDDRLQTKWFCGGQTTPSVDIALVAPHAVTSYSVTSGNDAADRDPKDWILQGSNDLDAGVWTDLDTQTGQTFANRYQLKTYTFTNATAYSNYRFKVTANNGSIDFQVAEIKLFGN